jgi:hypothetical protein
MMTGTSACRAQVAADVPAVRTRQHQVQQHQIPALAVDRGHRLQAVRLAMQAIACAFQVQTQAYRRWRRRPRQAARARSSV